MIDNGKEVYFGEYCHLCIHYGNKENEWPCYECLEHPVNYGTHRPERFESRTAKTKDNGGN